MLGIGRDITVCSHAGVSAHNERSLNKVRSNCLRTTKLVLILSVAFVLLAGGIAAGYDANAVPKFESPVFLTTAGQSIDWETVNVLCKRQKIDYDYDNLAKPEHLKGVKTLIVVPAHSNKGLGSAGIDVDGEMKRVKTLLAEAGKQKINVVLIHVGGSVRRGSYSDPFIDEVMKYAKYVVVWAEGNSDGYFTNNCKSKNIPLTVIDKVADLGNVLKLMFPAK